jgi:methionyl aminopeptidase
MPARFAWRAFFIRRGYHGGLRKKLKNTMAIKFKNDKDIAKMRVSGRLAAEVLAMIKEYVVPGVSTEELDRRCNEYIRKVQKATPANVGYHGFPKTLCTSVNGVVCHGIPSEQEVLKEGDIVNIDVTVIKDGWHGDTSRMYFVGEPSPEAKKLVDTTYDAMMAGIRKVAPGARLGDVGHAIQKLAEGAGYAVVREYCGHGIGRVYHEDPQVLHYGRPNTGLLLKEGMTFTVEPMINMGGADVEQLEDGWTVVTADHSLSAQWEHMVAVTRNGVEILTPWPKA